MGYPTSFFPYYATFFFLQLHNTNHQELILGKKSSPTKWSLKHNPSSIFLHSSDLLLNGCKPINSKRRNCPLHLQFLWRCRCVISIPIRREFVGSSHWGLFDFALLSGFILYQPHCKLGKTASQPFPHSHVFNPFYFET